MINLPSRMRAPDQNQREAHLQTALGDVTREIDRLSEQFTSKSINPSNHVAFDNLKAQRLRLMMEMERLKEQLSSNTSKTPIQFEVAHPSSTSRTSNGRTKMSSKVAHNSLKEVCDRLNAFHKGNKKISVSESGDNRQHLEDILLMELRSAIREKQSDLNTLKAKKVHFACNESKSHLIKSAKETKQVIKDSHKRYKDKYVIGTLPLKVKKSRDTSQRVMRGIKSDQEIKVSVQQLTKLMDFIEGLKREGDARRIEVKKLKRRQILDAKDIANFCEQSKHDQIEIVKLRKEMKRMRKAITSTKPESDRMAVVNVRKQMYSMRHKIQECAQTSIAKVVQSVRKCKATFQKEHALNDDHQKRVAAIVELESEISRMVEDGETKQLKIEKLRKKKIAQDHCLADLKKQRQDDQVEIQRLRHVLMEKEKALESAERLHQIKMKAKQAAATNSGKKQMNKVMGDLQEMVKEIQTMHGDMHEVEKENIESKLRLEIERLGEDSEEKSKCIDELQNTIKNIEEEGRCERQKLHEKIEALMIILTLKYSEVNETEMLRTKIKEQQFEITRLKTRNEELIKI